MQKIRGKQIDSNTLNQNKFNINYSSITFDDAATTQQWVESFVDNMMQNVHYNRLNLGMSALATPTPGSLATSLHIVEYPISSVAVYINGVLMNSGGKNAPFDCYFSGDSGVTARVLGTEQKGDYLYWNNSDFKLDTDDQVDFVFLVNYDYSILNPGGTYIFDEVYDNFVVYFTGGTGYFSN